MHIDHRKKLVFGSTLVAGLMLFSSAAFACTVFRGQMKVSDSNTPPNPPYKSDPGSVTVIGNNSGMGYCARPITELGGHIEGQSQVPRTGGSLTVVVSPTDECLRNGSNKLPNDRTYQIRWFNGLGFSRAGYDDHSNNDLTPGSRKWVTDCMAGGTPSGSQVGSMTVDSAGNGSATVTIPSSTKANGPLDESAICVSDNSGLYGSQAPVSVI